MVPTAPSFHRGNTSPAKAKAAPVLQHKPHNGTPGKSYCRLDEVALPADWYGRRESELP